MASRTVSISIEALIDLLRDFYEESKMSSSKECL